MYKKDTSLNLHIATHSILQFFLMASQSDPANQANKTVQIEGINKGKNNYDDENENEILTHRYDGVVFKLKRSLGTFQSFALSFTSIGVLSSLALGYDNALLIGGPALIINCWIVASFFNLIVVSSLAELSSAYPTSGSVMQYTADLSPQNYIGPNSFAVGWFNAFGNIASLAAFASSFSTIVNSLKLLNQPTADSITYVDQAGIAIGIVASWAVLNLISTRYQGKISIFGMLTNIITIFIISIVSWGYANNNNATASQVWSTVYNSSGNDDKNITVYLVLITISQSSLFAFMGFEASSHMAEETKRSEKNTPIAMILAVGMSGVMGLFFLLGILYPAGTLFDPTNDTSLNTLSGLPAVMAVVSTFINIISNTKLNTFLAFLLLLSVYVSGNATMTISSRALYPIARIGGIPFQTWIEWDHVTESTKQPSFCILLTFVCTLLLLFLQMINSSSFDAIVSITTIAFQISYFVPILLRIFYADEKEYFKQRQFSLGKFSKPAAIISCVWLFITTIPCFWPAFFPVTSQIMNYSCVVIPGFALLIMLYWFGVARNYPPMKISSSVVVQGSNKTESQVALTEV
jgi:amino acid transporter